MSMPRGIGFSSKESHVDKKVFGERYKITERIGIGGMAEVFKAQDSTLGRTVAVKVMLPQYAADRTFAARFRQEAQAAANLTSPYIVNIYDWGQDDGMYYIVMEYVRGTDLKSAIQSRGSIHPRKVAEIGSQVCSALSVAHSYNIIHRDIKSANIMVQTDGNVKVMDFGIAQAGNSDMTQDSNVLGTAHYVSPEQAQGKQLAGTSDLYSLGVVMYEACTGQLPFDGPDAVSVAMKQVSEQPVPPRAINSAIDASLEAIILKAMSKNPSERYATANEMKQALDDYLSGRGSAAATTVIGAAAATPGPAAGATRVIGPVDEMEGATYSNSYDSPSKSHGGNGSKKKGGKGKIAVIIAVIIVLIAAVGGGFALSQQSKAEQVIVPDVTNHTLDEATQILADSGLVIGDVQYQTSETVAKDLIIYQDPSFNGSIEKGGKVNVTVSQGKDEVEQVPVPNLLGLSEAEATKALEDAGFYGSSSEGYSDSVEAGKVYEQDVAAMTNAPKGTTIKFKVSLGKAQSNVPIASYIGQNADEVKADLESQGLKVTLQDGYSSSVSKGDVMEQSIPAGTSVASGSSITLTVCRGSKETPSEPAADTTVDVPNVTGMTESKAKGTLKAKGLTYSIDYAAGDNGKVISQDPSGGSVKKGSTVSIIVGTGFDDKDN